MILVKTLLEVSTKAVTAAARAAPGAETPRLQLCKNTYVIFTTLFQLHHDGTNLLIL